MRRLPVILLTLLLMVFLVVFAKAQDSPETPLIPPDSNILADMYARINVLRERRGLPPYRINDALNRAAQDQAEYLVLTGRRGHFRADGSRPSTRAAVFGFTSSHWCCGENYYMSIDATPDMVYNFWRWSPGHLVNMVHRDFTDIGLGMSSNGYRHSYVTIFGESDDLHPPNSPAAQTVSMVEQVAPPEPQTASANEAIPSEGISGEHIVLPGETLARIAARYRLSVQAIARANNIVNPEIIYPGQRLVLPGSQPPAPPPEAPQEAEAQPVVSAENIQSHVVIEGETLARIATRYGTTVQALVSANNIVNPSVIYAGQLLSIPAGQ